VGTEVTSKPSKPTLMGVPAAPKTTEVLLPKRPIITAVKGERPRPINKGATIMAGVPKGVSASKRFGVIKLLPK